MFNKTVTRNLCALTAFLKLSNTSWVGRSCVDEKSKNIWTSETSSPCIKWWIWWDWGFKGLCSVSRIVHIPKTVQRHIPCFKSHTFLSPTGNLHHKFKHFSPIFKGHGEIVVFWMSIFCFECVIHIFEKGTFIHHKETHECTCHSTFGPYFEVKMNLK